MALHGVYSWVAPSLRIAIVKFADTRLKTGGALYLSYNAAPGWMPRAPLQRLIFEYAKRHPAGALATTADALRFAKGIKDAGALYFQANPQVGAFIEAMEGKDLTYLAHENLNESWSALYHADVVADFSPTRLGYACAGHIADDIDETSIPVTTHDVLPGTSDAVWPKPSRTFSLDVRSAATYLCAVQFASRLPRRARNSTASWRWSCLALVRRPTFRPQWVR
jgi:Predicted methyltransferase regulatory domain